MWSHIKTIGAAALISVLVWIFAEAETLGHRELTVQFEIVPTEAGARAIVAKLAENGAGKNVDRFAASVRIQGAASRLNMVEQALRAGVAIAPGEGRLLPDAPGEHAVVLEHVLREHEAVLGSGVSIQRVEPATVRIAVRALVRLEVPVVVRSVGGDFASPPRAVPDRVVLEVLQEDAQRISPDVAIIAELDARALAAIAPGKEETIRGVPILLPAQLGSLPHARLTQSAIDVSLVLKERLAQTTVPTVPVRVLMDPVDIERWRIQLPKEDRELRDVTVRGPVETIERLKTGESRVVATIRITREDFAQHEARGWLIARTELQVEGENDPAAASGACTFQVADRMVTVEVQRRE